MKLVLCILLLSLLMAQVLSLSEEGMSSEVVGGADDSSRDELDTRGAGFRRKFRGGRRGRGKKGKVAAGAGANAGAGVNIANLLKAGFGGGAGLAGLLKSSFLG